MSIDKIKQKLLQNSIKDSGWLEKAKWRQENEDWLDISFSIAVRVASTLASNKKSDKYPKSQVELADAMGCSAQYVNKLLRGQEKLQIDTICKVQRILGIKLIEVPKVEIKQTISYNSVATTTEKIKITSPLLRTSNPYTSLKVNVKVAGEGNYALAA
ncbi:MAG: hypothetical protein DCF13_01465 [Flavobacteriaceae bacterium]|nr:MAG: hypothetical protein DCF13_01465 [Flavobacteriaceae bacterium]